MIILASQSPRRREIIERLGVEYKVCPSDADEHIEITEPEEYAAALAERKARAVYKSYPDDTVVAADTIVCLDGKILGKPHSRQEAYEYLSMLSGRSHRVITAVAVIHQGKLYRTKGQAEVKFRRLTDDLINEYIDSGEPMDKAGAYGIQGIGGRFAEGINGDFFSVMGLPLCALSELFESLGIIGRGERA